MGSPKISFGFFRNELFWPTQNFFRHCCLCSNSFVAPVLEFSLGTAYQACKGTGFITSITGCSRCLVIFFLISCSLGAVVELNWDLESVGTHWITDYMEFVYHIIIINKIIYFLVFYHIPVLSLQVFILSSWQERQMLLFKISETFKWLFQGYSGGVSTTIYPWCQITFSFSFILWPTVICVWFTFCKWVVPV